MRNLKAKITEYTFGVKGVWKGMSAVVILALLVAIFGVLNAACLKLLLDIAARDSSITILWGAVLALIVITLQSLWKSIYMVSIVKVQNKIARKAKSDLLNHIEKMPQERLSAYHTGDLLTRISDDTDICAGVLPDVGSAVVVGVLSCAFSLGYAFYLSWKLAILCVILSPMAALWSKFLIPVIQKYAALSRQKESAIRAFSQEEITYIPVIKSFSSYAQSRKNFVKKFDELAHARTMSSMMNAVLSGGSNVVGFFSFIGTAALGGYLSLKGEITVGTIIGFLQVLNYIVWPFTELMPLLGEFQEGKAARNRLKEIEEIPCEEDENNIKLKGDDVILKLQDVSFSFGENDLFRDVNLNLTGKQLVGVMGPSGCGKSTFIQILIALYKPSNGTVCLTDNRCTVEGTSIRKHIAYVPQDHTLITGTIAENIAYGQEEFEMFAVMEAAIHEFILSLPEQYETRVEEKGGNLSFGQAQRIAIARAIFKDVPVLILDEPTASLDSDSKQIIINTLKKEAEKKLCIMVCHDQSENREVFDSILEFTDIGNIYLTERKK